MRRTTTPPLPDLHGRRALVTGASDGIGLEIATRLAGAGAELVLPVRNRAKGAAAVDRIRVAAPGAQVELADLDLASLDSVTRLADGLLAEGRPLHLLVNNAGVMTPPQRQETADGLELQLGTNHVAHVALVARLLPLLRDGGARVVSQVSVAAARGAIDWDDVGSERSYDGQRAYSRSKIAQGLFGLELDRRSRAHGWGITSTLSHPGVAPTSLLAARPEIGRSGDTPQVRLIRALSSRRLLVGDVHSAALPALLASHAGGGGRMYGPSGLLHLGGPPAEQALYRPLRSEEEARRVWAVSQELAGVTWPQPDVVG